jgi:hypothetical protein
VFDIAGVFASMFVLSVFVILIDVAVTMVERRLQDGGLRLRLKPALRAIHSMTSSARARQGPAQGDATVNSNYRLSDSPPIHPVARSILRTGTPEPRIKLSRLKMGH